MALKTRTISTPTAVGGDAKIEEYLDAKGVKWTFRPKLAPAFFDFEKSLRNQVRFQAVDERRVDTYAEAMRRGDKFPPVIAHGAKLLILCDGNHRGQASLKTNRPLDVYDITGTPPGLITQIGYESNVKHGLPTSEAERMQQAIWLIDEGATPKTAAAALVIPLSALTKAVANRNTDQRFRASGIAPIIIEKLNEPLKRRLAQVTTDEGFVALTELVAAASLKSDVVYELVTNINEIRSSAKQVQFVELQKDVYLDDIQASGGGVITRRRFGAKQRIGMALGQVLNLPDDIEAIMAAYHEPEREEAAKRMRAAARRLNEIAKQLTSA